MSRKKINWMLTLPLVGFLGLSVFMGIGLFSDPRERESALIEKQFPEFSLPDLMDENTLHNRQTLVGEPLMVNVWGVWCVTCNAELGFLTQLRNQGVKIVGLYYEQEIDPDFGDTFDINQLRFDVTAKLTQRGDPYQYNMLDMTRSVSFDLGVTGAPETFLVDRNGVIRMHHIGDINPRVWAEKIQPVWEAIQ